MSVKVYENGAWRDYNSVKHYNNGSWQDAQSLKVYDDGAWIEKLLNKELYLFNNGDQCTAVTNGWKASFAYDSRGYNANDAYLSQNYLVMDREGGYGSSGWRPGNLIDMSGYNYINFECRLNTNYMWSPNYYPTSLNVLISSQYKSTYKEATPSDFTSKYMLPSLWDSNTHSFPFTWKVNFNGAVTGLKSLNIVVQSDMEKDVFQIVVSRIWLSSR